MSALSFDLKLDDISPSLSRLNSEKLRDELLMGIGTVIQSMAQRAFDEPGLRPTPWAQRKSGGAHPLLIKSGDLRQGIHVIKAGADTVRIGSPTKYAAHHQLGSSKSSGRGSGVPARPFFPVLNDQLTGNAKMEIKDVVDALIGSAA